MSALADVLRQLVRCTGLDEVLQHLLLGLSILSSSPSLRSSTCAQWPHEHSPTGSFGSRRTSTPASSSPSLGASFGGTT